MKKNSLKNKKMVLVIIAVLIGGCMLPVIDSISDSSILKTVQALKIESQQRNIYPDLQKIDLFSSIEDKRNPFPLGDRDSNDSWWNTNWKYRKEITVNHSKVDADLSNFPVLFSITDVDLRDDAQSSGNDIVFTDKSGTKLAHEIEFFNSTNGELICWTNVTSLSSTENTSLYLYYGNPSCSSQQDPDGVWDSAFLIVQHLNETSGTHYDSTNNENNGAPQGSLNQDLAGQIDGADGFNGTISDNDWINCGSDNSLNINDEITIESWVNRTDDGTGSYPGIVSRTPTSGTKRYQLRYNPSLNRVQFFLGDGSTYDFVNSNSDLSLNSWTHVVGTWDGSTLLLFVDGVQQSDTGLFSGSPVFTTEILEIGRYYTSSYFEGGIDEVRVSDILRNSSWISTEYNNQNDPSSFFSLGGEEEYIPPVYSWWNPSWKYRKNIIIDNSKVDADLTDFPVLVSISSDSDLSDSSKCQVDGDDIVFTDVNGIQLSHEIEFFDDFTGELVAWINVTTLSSTTNTLLFMYYGNSGCSSQQDVSGVWNSAFMIVQHLNETSGTHYDSTSNGNDGTNSGSTQDYSGQIDGANSFDGSNDYIGCGGDSSLDIGSAITIEAWVYRTAAGAGSYPGITNRAGTSTNRYQLRYKTTTPTSAQFFLGDSSGYIIVSSNADLPVNTWTHIVGTWDGSTMRLFVDGVQQTQTGSFSGSPSFTSSNHLDIGRYSTTNFFAGGIDEIRISNILRNSSWIATEYNNQYDPSSFYSIGSEEIYQPPGEPIVSNESPVNNSKSVAIGVIALSVLVNDTQGDNMDVYFKTNASGSWTNIGVNTSVSNGTYSQEYTFNNYGNYYWWSVNVTDPLGSGNWTNKTFMFSTEIGPVTNPFVQGWKYLKEITIDHEKVDCDLINFPVYINLIDTDLRDKANNSGDDIIFMDDEGVANRLNHEIEYYNSVNGNLIAWVNVTSVSSLSNTSFYMYYGNPLASNMENASGVWDSYYMVTQHLSETSGIHYDSTSNGNDGTCVNGTDQNAVGFIDGADDFDGSNDWIDCGNDTSLDITDEITIEAWVYKTGNGQGTYPAIVSRASGTKRYQFRYRPSQTNVQFFLGDGTTFDYVVSNSDLPTNTWTHVVGTWDGSTMLLFVDGVQQTDTGTFTGSPSFADEILEIGRYTHLNYFAGGIDEVKISTIARSACWIAAEYNNQFDSNSFYSVSSEEGIPENPILSNESPEAGSIDISLEPILSIYAIDYQGDNMNINFRTNASGTWKTIGSNLTVGNGTYFCGNAIDINNYSRTYWWSVNATDPSGSGNWSNKTYVFNTRPENYYHLFTIDHTSHKNYGCSYPVTYIFDIPSDMMNLKAYKYDCCDWKLIPNRTRDQIQNGLEAARFNYTTNKAYISVAFPNITDSFIIDIVDENNESINASFNDIATHYDNKELAVVITCDDWYERYHDYFMTAVDRCQVRNLWFTPGIVTHGSAVYQQPAGRILPPDWDDMQQQIDEGFVEPASHSRNHIHLPYDEEQWGVQSSYDGEIYGSKQDIFENITLPLLNRRGNDEYLYAWIEPYGESSSTVRQKLGEYYYLSDRSTGSDNSFASWDSVNNVYNRVGTVVSLDSERDLDTLNGLFNSTYSSNGVYHMWGHARNHNWITGDVALHLDYISNRSDVWYVGFGHLYMYHYLEERNVISHSTDVSNFPIGICSESPANNSIGRKVGSTKLKIRAVNINNVSMDITFKTNESGSWEDIGSNNSVFNGFYQQSYSFPNYDTTYWWNVSCTDGTLWTNRTYTFTTRPENYIPIISNPNPSNGASGIAIGDVQLSITVSDQDGETMDITFRTNASGTWSDIGTNSSQPNGTYSQVYNFSESVHLYYWSVNCTDGKIWVNNTYYFTTERMTVMNPFSSGWQYRKRIDIDHDKVDCDLTNFPVLINISDNDLSSKAQSDGDDIVFMDGDGIANLLSHEIEYYNSGNLASWVNVASLSSTENTTLYMYYGNPSIINMEDVSGVWDTNFIMVQHLSEISGTHYDSTMFANDGTNLGSNQDFAGQIDGANSFDGTNDWVGCGNSETLDISDNITLEAWVNRSGDGTGDFLGIISRNSTGYNRYQLRYKPADNVVQFFLGEESTYDFVSSNSDLPLNTWVHVVGTWDGSTMLLFVDGVQQTDTGAFSGSPILAYETLEIGRYTNINYFSGGIDEVRISNVSRSACWISTEYDNQLNPNSFYSIGTEEIEIILEEYIVSLNSNWNKMSLPFNESVDKTDIIVSYSGTNYSWSDAVNNTIVLNFIYGWNRTNQNYELISTLEPGCGYWIWAYDNCDLLLMINSTPDETITSLQQFWNVIGPPFNTSIAKEDLIINYNGTNYSWYEATTDNNEEGEPLILGFIYGWNRSTQSYVLSDDIDSGFGYWMYAYYECVLKR